MKLAYRLRSLRVPSVDRENSTIYSLPGTNGHSFAGPALDLIAAGQTRPQLDVNDGWKVRCFITDEVLH